MHAYQQEFMDFLIETGALRFDEFTLKSGRRSPYFFNAGQFNTGAEIERLGYYYACAIREFDVEPTLVFGPAYKGIPLCIAAAIALRQRFDMDTYYGFDRKEIKEHGEGGWLVGKEPDGQDRVVLVDDVVTDGATKIQMIDRLKATCSARISGLVIALDRKEKKHRRRRRRGGSPDCHRRTRPIHHHRPRHPRIPARPQHQRPNRPHTPIKKTDRSLSRRTWDSCVNGTGNCGPKDKGRR